MHGHRARIGFANIRFNCNGILLLAHNINSDTLCVYKNVGGSFKESVERIKAKGVRILQVLEQPKREVCIRT